MRILLTGSNGFLSQKFCEKLAVYSQDISILGVSKSENRNPFLSPKQFKRVDLLDFEKLEQIILDFAPTHILHTAAITSVEECEKNPELSYATNVKLTGYLAQLCQQKNIHLVFISTDFVFDGHQGPYQETDAVHALNKYGEFKIQAEKLIEESNAQAAILRTILVYGAIADKNRSNLVLWAKKQLENNHPIKVVNDHWRMPTWVDDLSDACYLAMHKKAQGLFHISGNEMMSIHECVHIIADTWGYDKSLISAISSIDISQDKNRPARTGFILDRAEKILGYKPTSFIVSLHNIKQQLKKY